MEEALERMIMKIYDRMDQIADILEMFESRIRYLEDQLFDDGR